MDVLEHLTVSPDGSKIVAGAEQLINSETYHYATKALWANYAANETSVMKSQLPLEEREKQAASIRTRRLALEELLEEIEGLANTELPTTEDDNGDK